MKHCPYAAFEKKVAAYHAAGKAFEAKYKKGLGDVLAFGRMLALPHHGGCSKTANFYICYGPGYPRHIVDTVTLPESLFLLQQEVAEMAEKLFADEKFAAPLPCQTGPLLQTA